MAQKKLREFVVPTIIRRLAPQLGIMLVSEPEWREAMQITFKNGVRRYLRSTENDINPRGASAIARDKNYARFFIKKMGYSVPRSHTFFRERFRKAIGSDRDAAAAAAFAAKIGFPVIVKPNNSGHGKGVFMAQNERDVLRALKDIFLDNDIALVEKYIKGRDYRIVVLQNKVVAAYERIHPFVIGDGVSTVEQLFKKKITALKRLGRDIPLDVTDSRMRHTLSLQKVTLKTVLKKDRKITLLSNANLSSGGDMCDLTAVIHPAFKKLAIDLTHDMGLRFCGVDIICESHISEAPKKYAVLELNSNPGLTHFASIGPKQALIRDNVYISLLKLLEKMK